METLPLTIGDILHYEATSATRESVPASPGLKAGQLVDYPFRSKKLIALTDEYNGFTQVQPYNCIMDLSHTLASEIDDLDAFKLEGDSYGIVYRNAPKTA